MKTLIKNGIFWVWFTTIYLIIYVALLSSGIALPIAFLMFSLSPFFILLMVITVLKDNYKTDKTFDEYFYQDKDWKR